MTARPIETTHIYEFPVGAKANVIVDGRDATVERLDATHVQVTFTSLKPNVKVGPIDVDDNDQLGGIVQLAAFKAGLATK
jgi:hypothetical protein